MFDVMIFRGFGRDLRKLFGEEGVRELGFEKKFLMGFSRKVVTFEILQ